MRQGQSGAGGEDIREMEERYGLLGEKLGHSCSPLIHSLLGEYRYELIEKTPAELDSFLKEDSWRGLNVTIPYKKAVLPYAAELSPAVCQAGSANVLLRREDGSIAADNTDLYGFLQMVRKSGIRVQGRKVLVLGNGGAAGAVCAALRELSAREIRVISRRGEDNYTNLSRHADAELIVNTTPLGMYPENGQAAVDLKDFPVCAGVFDLIYNPLRTALLLQAEQLGIPSAGGLSMLVAQAARAAELFTGQKIPAEQEEAAEQAVRLQQENIVLIGMPGCGKSTVAALLGERLSRPVIEADALIAERAGKTIPRIFETEGEEGFRRRETEILAEAGKRSGIILSTGGGCVTRRENFCLLRQNGRIFLLQRDLEKLSSEGRPLSESIGVSGLFRQRKPLYEAFADCIVSNDGAPEETLRQILQFLHFPESGTG